MTRLSSQPQLPALDIDSRRSLILIVRLLHLGDAVEPADHVGGAEAFTGLYVAPVQLLDEADVAALVAPGLGDFRRVERHPNEPRTRFAVQLHLITPDHA